ncbi:ankyrin and armadillo repeat-containing [Labeo rohita]|uniref:Ankyrin and armadillo repeat-containing n=1 Tax=Labeo rohita TaxID=84645 RepID=A0A498NIB3_LABRO|nr:ankyrin and armadillo repeat-containing [Labeo rohita]
MANPSDQRSEKAVRAALTAQSLLQKYDRKELQELLSLTSCNWLLSAEEHNLPVDAPPGIIRQMRNILAPNIIILAPFDSNLPLDYRMVHQIVRELTVGIYGFNQVPAISLVPNYDQSSTCQLPPAYHDTKVGQILINVDYTMKTLWHGSYIPREKRIRFSELWRSIMAVGSDGVPQTKKDVLTEFLNAGLTDISDDPCYQDIYKENIDVDPTYEPNSAEEENLFSQYSENILMKLSANLTSVRQHQNLFVFEASSSLSNVVRLIEDNIDLATYQRLQKRLSDHVTLVRKHLERNAEVSKDLVHLKLITFLVPLLISLRKKMLVPNLSQMLPPLSDDKLKTEREVPPHLLGPDFACKHFPQKGNQYFHLHGGIEFDVGTPPLDDITEEMKVAFRTLQTQAANYLSELLRQDSTYKTHFPIPLSEIDGKSYNVICIELESLYPQHNLIQWWGALNSSIKILKGKRLPLTDIELHEQFKKTFGCTKAIKCKTVAFGLKAAAERGMCAAFQSLSRRNPASHLHVLDEQGLSLLHHAAANNQPHIILQLAAAGVNINQIRSERFTNSGGIPVLVGLLCSDRLVVQCMATAVLCQMSENRKVCEDLVIHGAVPVVIKLLSGHQPELHSRCAVILADLAGHSEHHQNLIAQLGGVALVVKLLTSDLQDVLVNAVRCIRKLCVKSQCNQTAVAHAGGVPHLVEFLSVNSEVLQEEACLALAEMARGHQENQRLICEAGAVSALVQALRERKIPVKVKAATALESIASHNPAIQQCFLRQSAAKYLLQLLKVFQLDVREQGATSLWTLAGQTVKQQKLMAEQMGYPVILDLLLSSSDKMQYVGVALTTNKKSQKTIYREKAIPTLLELLKSHESLEVKVQVAQTLACVLLGNQKLQRQFWEQEDFSYNIILELLEAENKSICLDAGRALSLFAYNNKAQQKAIRQTGRILMNTYETFLSSDSETERAKAAFQFGDKWRASCASS